MDIFNIVTSAVSGAINNVASLPETVQAAFGQGPIESVVSAANGLSFQVQNASSIGAPAAVGSTLPSGISLT